MIKKVMNWLGYMSIEEHKKEMSDYKIKLQSSYEELIRNIKYSHNILVENLKKPVKYIGRRRAGNTTRLADWYIQRLFNERKITVKDHHDARLASVYLFETIVRRLSIEHKSIQEFIKIDKSTLTIKLYSNKKDMPAPSKPASVYFK